MDADTMLEGNRHRSPLSDERSFRPFEVAPAPANTQSSFRLHRPHSCHGTIGIASRPQSSEVDELALADAKPHP
jgi:hypothetical protein